MGWARVTEQEERIHTVKDQQLTEILKQQLLEANTKQEVDLIDSKLDVLQKQKQQD